MTERLSDGESQSEFRSRVHRHRAADRRMDRRRAYALFGGCTILLAVLVIWFSLQLTPVQRKYIYPFPYRATIERYAGTYGVDAHLAAAVIKAESKFQNDVHSHRGAVGLMQLMPETAGWIAEQIDDYSYSVDGLHDPERNIRYGIWYLSSLQREFYGNDVLALAAYNAGRGNVRDWMQKYGWGSDFSDIDAIPFNETREYVRRVLHDEKEYDRLYQQ